MPAEEEVLDADVFLRLKSFKGETFFKRAALNIFVKMIDPTALKKMSEQFAAIDVDSTGLIDADELKAFVRKMNLNITDADVKKMFDELDYYGTGMINYTEFLAATIDYQNFFDDTKLRSVFSIFDTDQSG